MEQTEGQSKLPPVVYSVTDAVLAELAEKYKDIPDATDKEGYLTIKQNEGEVRALRLAVEDRRKFLKKDALEYGRQVDGEAKRLTQALMDIETPLKQARKAEDERKAAIKEQERKAEEERIEAIKARVSEITDTPRQLGLQATTTAISNAIARIKATEITEEEFGEFYDTARADRGDVLIQLQEMLANRTQYEKEQAELEEQRKTREEEQKRLDAEREQREAAEQARKDEEEKKLQEQRDQIARERAELDAEKKARADAEAEEERKRQAEVEAENERLRAEQEARDKAEAEEEERKRQELLRPEKERVKNWVLKLRFIDGPSNITDKKLLAIVNEITSALDELSTGVVDRIDQL